MAKLMNYKYFSVLAKLPCSNQGRCLRAKAYPNLIDLLNKEGLIRSQDNTGLVKIEFASLQRIRSPNPSNATDENDTLAGEPKDAHNAVIALRDDISEKWNQTHSPDSRKDWAKYLFLYYL